MATSVPGQFSVVVPVHEATGKLTIDFARNPSKFAVNEYAQIVPVTASTGLYLKVTVEEAARILSTDGVQFIWPDGQPSPTQGGLEEFEYVAYRTKRRAYEFPLGNLTVKNAPWDVVAQHARIKAQLAMTMRTQVAITALTTTTNYASSHVLTVSSITGNTGNWAQSTTARQDIRRSLAAAVELILDDTLAAVEEADLKLVINSELARKMAESQEIVDYIKGSPHAKQTITDGLGDKMHGMPASLYGYPVVIEKTRKVTSARGAATTSRSQVLPTATPFLCARPGSQVSPASDAPNFSTCVLFMAEEMTVEQIEEELNRRVIGRVVEDYSADIVAPASGVLFQSAA